MQITKYIKENAMKKILVFVLSLALFFSCDMIDPGNGDGDGDGDGNGTPTLTTEQKEAAAEGLMDDGQLDEALAAYEEILQLDDASAEASIRWSMLKLASISVHEDVRTLASDLGIQEYPTTMNEALGGESTMDPMSALPTVANTDMFSQFDEMEATMIALLYNMKTNYPDGFDPIMDGFINATAVMDEIITELDNLDPGATFALTYDMFNDQPYDSYNSSWPLDNNGQPGDIVLGKAEVLLFAASLEGVRAFAFAANSISMKVDLDGYWEIFNPVDGDFYEFDEFGDIVGVDETYDFANFEDPIKYGLFETSDDATDMLAQSRVHFANVFRFIKEAGDLVATRTANDDFFISPANVGDQWEMVVDINTSLGVVMDKVIDSIENDTTIYIPMPTEDEYDENDVLISEGQSMDEYILFLGDEANWPTAAGDGVIVVNLGKMFEKPLFAIENIIELDETRGFVIYEYSYNEDTEEETVDVATAFDEANTYAVKVVDNTFNGVIDENIASEIPNYIPIPTLFAATELTPKGDTYVVNGVTYTSDGSIFHLIKYIDEDLTLDPVDPSIFEGQYLELREIYYEDLDGEYITDMGSWSDGWVDTYAYFESGVMKIYEVEGYWDYSVDPAVYTVTSNTYTESTYSISGYDIITIDGVENYIEAYTYDDDMYLNLEISGVVTDSDDIDGDLDDTEQIMEEYNFEYADSDIVSQIDFGAATLAAE